MLGCDTLDTARKLSIGRGTVLLYCSRVCKAIRCLKPKYLSWFTEDQKENTISAIEKMSGFEMCLGCGDGTLIPFTHKPLVQGEAYMSRKGTFGVHVTLLSSLNIY
jgi:hypothetical protein